MGAKGTENIRSAMGLLRKSRRVKRERVEQESSSLGRAQGEVSEGLTPLYSLSDEKTVRVLRGQPSPTQS